ncbi:MAG: hypothetical protein DRP74_07100 [Candidatus Omnitrophota bacterium]|nr:MAG: hypothetical protein DRP74_07100 [Candidatus Omnitrophota bacterium]
MAPLRVVRKKIGELLIERGLITQKQLDIALEKLKKNGGYLSQHLIAMGFVSEEDIAVCLSNQYNFAYLPLKNYTIPPGILDTIPLKWIKIYTLIPIDKIGNILSVAMADPLNEGVIQMLQQITNCQIMVFISTYTELKEVINRYFGEKFKNMEEHIIGPQDLDKIKTASRYIQIKAYLGNERREYVRLAKEFDIYFYYHSVAYRGKTNDISYGGVSFVSQKISPRDVSFLTDVFMPLNSSLACKIYLESGEVPIDAIIRVLRVQVLQEELRADSKIALAPRYEIAGVFEFITDEDRKTLFSLLQKGIGS